MFFQRRDPLARIKDVRIEHYQGPSAPPNPSGNKRPVQRPGETAVTSVDVAYDGTGAIAGELEVEPIKDEKFVYWFRPVFVNGNQQELFARELSGMRAPPIVRSALNVKFQPRPGQAAPIELTNVSTFRLRLSGGTETSRSLLLKVIINPENKPASANDPQRLLIKYSQFTIGTKVDGKPEKNEEEFQKIGRNMLQTTAVINLETDGTPVQTEVDMGKSEPTLREALTEINEHMLQALELVAVPISNGVVQPLQTFHVQRDVAAGMPGLAIPARVDLKFKYQGTHNVGPNRPSAMFDFNGTVRPRRGDKLNIGGQVYGRVEVAPDSGEILKASTDLKVDVDLQSSAGIVRITGTMHGEIKPPAASTPTERKPEKPPIVAAGDQRLAWRYKDQGKDKNAGSIKRNDDATWNETNSRGENFTFEEWERNDKYVVLVDPKRKVYLRCYDDHTDIFSNRGNWVLLYMGSWESE
jgi:hypothetical protein